MTKLKTEYVDADRILKVCLTKDKQLECIFGDKKDKYDRWNGAIQKIYNDKDGQTAGYDVYIY